MLDVCFQVLVECAVAREVRQALDAVVLYIGSVTIREMAFVLLRCVESRTRGYALKTNCFGIALVRRACDVSLRCNATQKKFYAATGLASPKDRRRQFWIVFALGVLDPGFNISLA